MKMSRSPKTRANGSTQPRQKSKDSPQRSKPPRHKLRRHKELPLNTCRLPLSKCKLPLNKCSIKESKSTSRPWPVRSVPLTGQTDDHYLDRSNRCQGPVRPVTNKAQKMSETPENLPNVFRTIFPSQTSPPCWQCMNQGKIRKNSARSFSNRLWAPQNATLEIMSKQDSP